MSIAMPGVGRMEVGLSAEQTRRNVVRGGLLVGGLVVLCWSHWPTISDLWRQWQRDPNYSVGQLVPLAALYLVWQQRRALRALRSGVCWWGAGLLLGAEATRYFGLLFLYESIERYALVLATGGLLLWVGGWKLFWELRWILAFLTLMVPLPGRIHNAIAGPLQDWATAGTVFVLELIGVTVVREGNVLSVNGHVPIGIEEACSGLRLLTAFVVVAALFILIVRRPRWQQTILLLSSVPIALACNIVRVVATVVLYVTCGGETAQRFVHDFAGIIMMPLAVALLIGELWLLDRLAQSTVRQAPSSMNASRAQGVRAAQAPASTGRV